METRCFLAVLLDQYDILENNEVEVKDMCQAWDGAMMMFRDEGKREGKYAVAQNMYRKGFSVEDTAGLVDEDIETVRKWFQKFSRGVYAK